MALSNEDKKDVSAAFGKKAAGAVSKATHDKSHPVTGHSQWLTQQIKKDNPAYHALGKRALEARRSDSSKSKALRSKSGDTKHSKTHGERQYSLKKRMELNYPKGFPHH